MPIAKCVFCNKVPTFARNIEPNCGNREGGVQSGFYDKKIKLPWGGGLPDPTLTRIQGWLSTLSPQSSFR